MLTFSLGVDNVCHLPFALVLLGEVDENIVHAVFFAILDLCAITLPPVLRFPIRETLLCLTVRSNSYAMTKRKNSLRNE